MTACRFNSNDEPHLPRTDDITVLIPAAGRVPSEPVGATGIGCPAMIPVGGRPVLYWTLRYLRGLGLRRFVIAVAERGMYIEQYVRYLVDSECDVQFVKPTIDGGLGRTVFELVETVTTPSTLIVLGDTFFRFADPTFLSGDESVVLTHPVDESFRWCLADVDAAGYVNALHDKQLNVADTQNALIGVYYFPQTAELRAAAQTAAGENGSRIELARILREVGEHRRIKALPAGEWRDCGNADLQLGSHTKLLESRAFNHLHVEPLTGIIRKQSEHAEKLIDEINYLRLLPPELAVLFPRLIDFSIAADAPWMRMEYFAFPTLAEAFLYERLSTRRWTRIFERLRGLLTEGFMRWPRTIDADSMRAMYLGKSRRRLDSLQGPPELLRLVHDADALEVNGVRLQNLNRLWPQIESRIDAMTGNGKGCVIHGDLCLSNILYDWRSEVCKLIDPRGSFGSSGIYGDPRYDVAKLYHSVYGGYDFIVHDLFDVTVDGHRVTMHAAAAPHHAEIGSQFEATFFPLFDRDEILLLTALLFISMPPLHYDHPRRQIAMYLRGVELLNELLNPKRQ